MDQAMRCAKREPGRSWEAIESELNKLGEHAEHAGLRRPPCNLLRDTHWEVGSHADIQAAHSQICMT